MMFRGLASVFQFEMLRTMTVSRLAIWSLLIAFPVFIVSVLKHYEEQVVSEGDTTVVVRQENGSVIRYQTRQQPFGPFDQGQAGPEGGASLEHYPESVWGLVFFGLIPEVITLFGLLLWVTPMIHTELEGKTWIYLAVRPRGRASVLLGKYAAAMAWTLLAGWTSTTICVWIARPEHAWRLWATIVSLVTLACLAYGALYSLFAAVFPRRAMVIAVAYTLVFEFLVSLIPAVINQLTVQYRLRNLLIYWMDWRKDLPEEAEILFGNEPAWQSILVLLVVSSVLLAVAYQLIQRREYATAAEA